MKDVFGQTIEGVHEAGLVDATSKEEAQALQVQAQVHLLQHVR